MGDAQKPKDRPAIPARILVVEDQASIREFARAVLTMAGHDVAVAADGAEAVAAVRDARFDLILMDVQMPVMDGPTAARQIRALKGLKSKVPIIAMSGDMQSRVATGMDGYICKPFRKAELLLKVSGWLNGELALSPASPPEEPGGTVFEEACELMGRPWAVQGLTKLQAQIDEAFGGDPARNKEHLAGQAHALVSIAAIFGFSTLSDLCSTLEEACRDGHDLQVPFEAAKAAAAKARKSASGLIAGLQMQD